ncbi:MAG TPA: TIGR02281 family clan AA aspartic protease [Propylenella sp.]|nr:TIGR02281 family clan AA aspartic protease [Propylenella sp.]
MPDLDTDQSLRLLYLLGLLAFLLGGFGYWRRLRVSALGHLAVWALIVVALVVVYAYRAPLLRFAAPVLQELSPRTVVEVTTPDGGRELVILRAPDGHFHVDAEVNGVPVRFLVDTGASSTVLTEGDARRSGIDPAMLRFNRPVQTANGTAFFASARLDSLEIGPYRVRDVPVGVMPEDSLGISLLGMSTINRFGGWRIEGDRMVLTL